MLQRQRTGRSQTLEEEIEFVRAACTKGPRSVILNLFFVAAHF